MSKFISLKAIVDKYENLSLPMKASLWFTVCSILQKGISVITTPIFTRVLSVDQYGLYTVYGSWNTILVVFATLNLYCGVFNNGMTTYWEDKKKFMSSMVGLSTVCTLICFIVYIINISFWNKVLGLSTFLVLLLFLEWLLTPAFWFWSVEQRYDYKFKALVFITLIMSILSPLLGLGAIYLTTYKAEARITANVLITCVVGLIFYIKLLKEGKTFFNKLYWKFALKFNIPLIPHYLSMTALAQVDRIMISKMINNSTAAIYGVSYNVSMLMTIIVNAVNSTFVPYTYKSLKKGTYSDISKVANQLVLLIGGLTGIVALIGPEIIAFFAPKEYKEAIWTIPPVAMTVYFMFLYPLFGNIEFYFEKTIYVMIASCIGAILNAILNYLLIPIFGFVAAGYTTLFCYILFNVAHYLFYKKVLKENLPTVKELYDIKFIVCFSVLMLVEMIVVLFLYNYTILRYLVILLIIIIGIYNFKKIVYYTKFISRRDK